MARLHKEGISHLAFQQLAAYPRKLRWISTILLSSKDPYARKLAAYAIGYLPDASLEDFERVLKNERKLAGAGGFIEGLNEQSTVEDLVFSAVRLIKENRQTAVGYRFLERIVIDVTEGCHYWNTSNYAIATLMHYDEARFRPLFQDWSDRVNKELSKSEPEHSFETEREWRDAIAAGTRDQIVKLLMRGDESAMKPRADPDDIKRIDALLAALQAESMPPSGS